LLGRADWQKIPEIAFENYQRRLSLIETLTDDGIDELTKKELRQDYCRFHQNHTELSEKVPGKRSDRTSFLQKKAKSYPYHRGEDSQKDLRSSGRTSHKDSSAVKTTDLPE
jgi:hypothetical protein